MADLERLALAARHGDDVACGDLIRATQPAVWRLCRALGSGFDTDDLVQDVYARALRSLGSYGPSTHDRPPGSFLAWILTIARRVCADEIRRAQRQRRLIDRLGLFAAPTPEHLPDAHLDALLDALEPARREAFVLTQILGLSYDEAATVCDCPIGTIRSRVARARSDLAEMVVRAQAR